MRDKFQRFMQGRYGADELGRFLTILGLILIVINLFVRSSILSYVVLAILIYCYYRMFSRNGSSRYAENQKFLSWRNRVRSGPSSWKAELEQRKVYHIYRCPSCRQKIRVPRGKGNIIVTCPKCRTEFKKKS
ncbi:MAG TPA: hypothetical protein IAB61_01325 [Candidatus Merdisoma merdipullorum]|nr:hypothetical protein [Candidatus Merdisoma merdipullorum]